MLGYCPSSFPPNENKQMCAWLICLISGGCWGWGEEMKNKKKSKWLPGFISGIVLHALSLVTLGDHHLW